MIIEWPEPPDHGNSPDVAIEIQKVLRGSSRGWLEGTPRLEPNGLVGALGAFKAVLGPSEDRPLSMERAAEAQELQVRHHHL